MHKPAIIVQFAAAICAVMLMHARTAAQCPGQWFPGEGYPGVNGTVYAITNWDPDGAGPQHELVVVGGAFSIAGRVLADNIAAWDDLANEWVTLPGGGTNRPVKSLLVMNGDLIVGGAFTTVNDGMVSANRIAQLDHQTGAWYALGDGFDSDVLALIEFQSTLIAAGQFTNSAGAQRGSIAKWHEPSATWLPLTLNGASYDMNNVVKALTIYNGALLAGGMFTIAGGAAADRIAYLVSLSARNWQPISSGMNSDVNALLVANGVLYAGGKFTIAGGQNVKYSTQWTASGWQAMGTTLNSDVNALWTYNNQVIAGGGFSSPSGAVAKWSGTTWQSMGFDAGYHIRTLASSNGKLFVGGNTIRQWSGPSGPWQRLGTGDLRNVETITVWRDKMILSGMGIRYNGPIETALYNIEGDGTVGGWHQFATTDLGLTTTSCVFQGEFISGGHFCPDEPPGLNFIGRWNGTSWQTFGDGVSAFVNAILNHEGNLYAAGMGLNRWHASAAEWQHIAAYSASALVSYQGKLIVGGNFNSLGGIPMSKIGQYDSATGACQPLGDGFNGQVAALAMYKGRLIASGFFTGSGAQPVLYIAQWNPQQNIWQPMGVGMNGNVRALKVYNGKLFAGGDFTTAGGVPANRIAQWDGQSWQPLGVGVADEFVFGMCVYGSDLFLGGYFNRAGGYVSTGVARWRDCNLCMADVFPIDGGDRNVNVDDLLQVLLNWDNPDNNPGDANHDGEADVDDLLVVIQSWGQCP